MHSSNAVISTYLLLTVEKAKINNKICWSWPIEIFFMNNYKVLLGTKCGTFSYTVAFKDRNCAGI